MAIKNPFGYRGNQIVHISDIRTKGLDCNCLCPSCKERLVACLGDEKIHHFRHYRNDCGRSGLETGLHKFAKQILSQHRKLKVPALSYDVYKCIIEPLREANVLTYAGNPGDYVYFDFMFPEINKEFNKLFPELSRKKLSTEDRLYYASNSSNRVSKTQEIYSERVIVFDNVELEVAQAGIVSDILAAKNGKQLIVEFKVTHEVDAEKLDKLKDAGLPTIEIDLSNVGEELYHNRLALTDHILNKTENKVWLFNTHLEKKIRGLEEKVAFLITKNDELLKKKASKEVERKKRDAENRKRQKQILEKYSDKQYQDRLKVEWSKELQGHPEWIRTSAKLNIDVNSIPPYLNKEIADEIMIQCDRRLWQALIFRVYMFERLSKCKSPFIKVSHIVDFVKKNASLPLNHEMVYTKHLHEFELDHYPGLDKVIADFLLNLEEYGFVEYVDGPPGTPYHWLFRRLKDKLDLTAQKVKSPNKNASTMKKSNMTSNDDDGPSEIPLHWRSKPIGKSSNLIVHGQADFKSPDNNQSDAFFKLDFDESKQGFATTNCEETDKSKIPKSLESRQDPKCLCCGKVTDDWVIKNGKDDTCVCRNCKEEYYKNRELYQRDR